jgi:NAD(P)-dependent dehydrogenase (short-subunit alcohol dehydrogenase family)
VAGVEGRSVVVTGAGGGLGRQHALLFAQHGAKVVVNDRGGARDGTGGSSEVADAVVAEITAAGGDAVANADDVSTPEGGAAIVQAALDAFGSVDVVVNNAGILRDSSFHKLADQHWDAVLAVHLSGTYHVTRAAWPHMREQRFGRVIVTTSTSGLYGNFGQANYAAAKLGVVGLVHALAVEGARYGITANAVAPLAATRMTEDVMPADELARLDPAYVSPLVVRLAGEECTDTDLVVLAAGGRYAQVRAFESQGAAFDEVPTVDALAERWDEVLDLSDARPGENPLG